MINLFCFFFFFPESQVSATQHVYLIAVLARAGAGEVRKTVTDRGQQIISIIQSKIRFQLWRKNPCFSKGQVDRFWVRWLIHNGKIVAVGD